VIHRLNRNRDPPTRPLDTGAPPSPRPPPLPLNFNFTFPEWDKDWRKRGPAFPGVPYPDDGKRKRRKKKKSRDHGMDDGSVRVKPGDQDPDHHEIDKEVVRVQRGEHDQDPHQMDDGVVRLEQENPDHDVSDHHEGGNKVASSRWGGEEGEKVMDVVRQIRDWIHESMSRKGRVSLVSSPLTP
jgi:hypothetical protein